MSWLLWEIGCEEIPAGMLPPAIAALQTGMTKALSEAGLWTRDNTRVESHGTPRRLMVAVTGMAAQQPDVEQLRRGPPVSRAFNPQGQPTRAAEGFAQSCGVAVADLERLETPKGTYLTHTQRQTGATAAILLPPLLQNLLAAFPWPKTMRWGTGTMRFVRPVAWMLVLLDGTVLPFKTVDGLAAGKTTQGHRFMDPGPHAVRDIAHYRETLLKSSVVLELEQRRSIIRQGVEKAAAQEGGGGGRAVMPPELLTENAGLTEWPVPLLGRFHAKFLEIPPEVLTTSMKYHQKYFPVADAEGGLLPCFVAVANLETPDPNTLVKGFERVLRARLEDAAFFWTEDQTPPLPDRLESLRQVVFHARLGTMHQKVMRMATLAGAIAASMNPAPPAALAEKAARLCKCDLVTGMVAEFPELQGIMGDYYLRAAGGEPEVAAAIREHYRPQGAADALPTTPLGITLSLADKLDTLTGCFALGLTPSGAKDPFALRRAALGIIRMVLAGKGLALPLRKTLTLAHTQYAPDTLEKGAAKTVDSLLNFFYRRLKPYLKANGFDHDLIDAVQALELDDLHDAVSRVRALAAFKKRPHYETLVAANKRIANILTKAGADWQETCLQESDPDATGADSDLRQLPAEKGLATAIDQCQKQVVAQVRRADYGEAMESLASLRGVIDRFFEEVLVMDPNPVIRNNRLALLARVQNTFRHVADVSRLEVPD